MWNPYNLWLHRLSQAAVRTLDGIIDTVSANHEISQLLPLLDVDGTLVLLGVPVENHTFHTESVLYSRRAPIQPRVLLLHRSSANAAKPIKHAHAAQAVHRRQPDWQHQGDAGDAGLLWREEHHL